MIDSETSPSRWREYNVSKGVCIVSNRVERYGFIFRVGFVRFKYVVLDYATSFVHLYLHFLSGF
jgi:hypothetical protein